MDGLYKCSPREIIEAVPDIQTVRLPSGWFDNLRKDKTVYFSLYEWMLENGRIPDCEIESLPGRTFVGEKISKKLHAAEKKRLNKKLKIKGDELDRLAGWSDFHDGPEAEICGCRLTGDVILVFPESSRVALNEFLPKLRSKRREAHINKIRTNAAGSTFYGWLVSQIDRPDHIGDFARDADSGDNFPRDARYFEEIKSYLDQRGACGAAIESFKDAWLEYLQQYPERVNPYAWCSECGNKTEVSDAFLAWDKVSQEFFVLDASCLRKLQGCYKLGSRPLQGISYLEFENLIENKDVSDYDVEKIVETLKLWGVLSAKSEGYVYFIKSEKTHEVKIGFTAGAIEKRMASLQTAHPCKLKLMAIIPGSLDYENSLHEKFDSIRLHGEWFSPSPDLLAFIEQLK